MDIAAMMEKHRQEVERMLHDFIPPAADAEWLRRVVGGDVKEYDLPALEQSLLAPVRAAVFSGGKRWRPLLATLCCEAVGGKRSQLGALAVIPELLHNGSLVIDDIEDGSLQRRGMPALHAAYGVDIAINAGNALYYLPLIILQESPLPAATKERIRAMLSHEMLVLHIGQATDIFWHKNISGHVAVSQYLRMCANKTGGLARFSARLGCIAGGGTAEQEKLLMTYAERLGIAFQVQDDILNIAGSLGKEAAEDITEGKISLPVILAMQRASPAKQQQLHTILSAHTADKKRIAEAVAILRESGAIAAAEKIAAEQSAAAQQQLTPLDGSPAKKALFALAAFTISRKK